jgi:hypothetical protein
MILYSRWVALPLSTRHQIAKLFNIRQQGAVEVNSNEISKDGYDITEIESILTVEALQKYLNAPEKDLTLLWEMLLQSLDGRREVPPPIPATASGDGSVPPVLPLEILPKEEAVKAKRKYVRRTNKK